MAGSVLGDAIAAALDRRADVLEAYLFGSHARGEAQPHSDIDVAVFLAPSSGEGGSGFGLGNEIAADLMSALGSDRVDLVVLNQAGPLLYHRVLRDGIRVVARDLAATTGREGRAFSRYCDYLPHLAKINAAHAARARRGGFGR